MIHVGKRILLARLLKGYTLKSLSSGITSLSKLSRIENGQLVPDPQLLQTLARKLDIPPAYFLDFDKEDKEVQLLLIRLAKYIMTGSAETGQLIDLIDSHYYEYLLSPEMECYYLLLKGAYLLKGRNKHKEWSSIHEGYINSYLESRESLPLHLENAYTYYHGFYHYKNYEFSSAISYFSKLKNNVDDLAIRATLTFNIALFYKRLNDYQNAILFGNEAINYYTALNNKHDTAQSLNLLGTMYRETGNYDQAKLKFHEAERIAEENGILDILGYVYHNLGLVEVNQDNLEKGIHFFLHALHIKQQVKNSNLLITYREIIECKLKEKKTKEASDYYWVAEALTNDEEDRYRLLFVFNDYYLLNGQMDEFKNNLKKLTSFFERTNEFRFLKKCYLKLGNFYYSNKNYKEASNYYYKHIELQEAK
ncbi:helix-turn-helix transcriptional regulator [Sediminibacillus massiliensis]|uniref:helix-turn-helix transcriptional regulator n=1 Tax=Sediminibacillus massiliensis TaxID=1926277 RepID=UPI000988402E|nr:helix-turn-helix transcriptional regulator [Sediminibacillus massiliensis]